MNKVAHIPELRDLNGQKVIYADGNPFLILSFQLDCDSCYSPETIATLLKNAKRLGCNAVSLLLYWRLIEPEEGKYDYAILEAMLENARANNLKIVLVWFGSYKNSYMHYAPDWIINDRERFPRVKRVDGSEVKYVSCYNSERTLAKDIEAVKHVFSYLYDHDTERSVILFQVNNETGIFGHTDRCYCDVCNDKFVREGFAAQYGSHAAEAFCTLSNLHYQESIAKNAKEIYPIPCYMNAWLAHPTPDSIPGYTYPAGGPVYRVLNLYNEYKKYIDFVSPDIYTPGYRDFMRICRQYKSDGNSLYIAEHALGKASRAYKNVYYAFGEFAAIGMDPWAIDCAFPDIMEAPLCDFVHERYSNEAYDMLESYIPIRDAMIPVAKNMGTDNLKYWVQEEAEEDIALDFGDVFVKVKYCSPQNGQSRGMAIRVDKNHFITIGCKSIVSFLDHAGKTIEIKDSFRGRFDQEIFISERCNTITWKEDERETVWLKESSVCTVTLEETDI